MDDIVQAAAKTPNIDLLVERVLQDHLRSGVVDVAAEIVSFQ